MITREKINGQEVAIEWDDLQADVLETDVDERMEVYMCTGEDIAGNKVMGTSYFFAGILDRIEEIEFV